MTRNRCSIATRRLPIHSTDYDIPDRGHDVITCRQKRLRFSRIPCGRSLWRTRPRRVDEFVGKLPHNVNLLLHKVAATAAFRTRHPETDMGQQRNQNSQQNQKGQQQEGRDQQQHQQQEQQQRNQNQQQGWQDEEE